MAAPSVTSIAASDLISDSRSVINTNFTNIAAYLDQAVLTTSTVTFANLTDSGLTASQAVMTDANKKLVSADYLDQAVKAASSPTFGGLALGSGSITMSGSIGVTGTRVTKGWFADLECTNAIAADITGDSATCSGEAATVATITTLAPDTATTQATQGNITSLGTLTGLTMGGNIVMGDNSVTGVDTITFTDTAGTIAGIANGNLLDKTAAETITENWIHQRAGTTDIEIQLKLYSASATRKGEFAFYKSHQSTVGLTETVDNELLGAITVYPVNSSSGVVYGGGINFEQDGNAGAAYVPMRIEFLTSTNAATPVERLTIDSAGVLTLLNATTNPSAHVDDNILIYAEDTSDSTSTLGLFTEQAVESGAPAALSHKVKVVWNGTEYWLGLDAV